MQNTLRMFLMVVIVLLSGGLGFFFGRIEMKHEIEDMFTKAFSNSGPSLASLMPKTEPTSVLPEPITALESTPPKPDQIKPTADEIVYYATGLKFKFDLDVSEGAFRQPMIRGTLKNIGNRTVSSLTVKITYFDTKGISVGEHVTSVINEGSDEDLLRPNYSKNIYLNCDNASPDWDKRQYHLDLMSITIK